MKERVLLQGVISDVKFPCKGKFMPTVPQPDSFDLEAPAGISYIPAKKEYGPIPVKNLLPGQEWIVSTGAKGRGSKDCHPLRLVKRADYEITASCPHADFCGGCLYQTVPYDRQLAMKETQVKELLKDVPGITHAQWEPICESSLTLGYRNKMEFSFGDEEKGGPLTLGLHKRGAFHDILSTPECVLVHPDLNVITRETQAFFRAAGVPKFDPFRQTGVLRHLVLRRSFLNGDLLVNLVASSGMAAYRDELSKWTNLIRSLSLQGRIRGILYTTNDRQADVVQQDALEVLFGEAVLTESLLGLDFTISPFSFFQTNTLGAEKLYSIVRDFAGDVGDKTVFDLYCGTGTIAQILASAGAKEVFGIEIVEEAIEAAKENTAINGLHNCHFIAGDVLKEIEKLTAPPDLVILDPPRDGIHPKALPKLLAFEPKCFIYVSCKPTSLARDLPSFTEAGYTIEKIRCCDMFPMTPHVETIVLLSRK